MMLGVEQVLQKQKGRKKEKKEEKMLQVHPALCILIVKQAC